MTKDLCEEGYGYKSVDYADYKPYSEPVKGYDRDKYVTYEDQFHMKIIDCHMCDIRLTGCIAPDYPRYFCHKDDGKVVSRQASLFEW